MSELAEKDIKTVIIIVFQMLQKLSIHTEIHKSSVELSEMKLQCRRGEIHWMGLTTHFFSSSFSSFNSEPCTC
jgi:hypothetical protein